MQSRVPSFRRNRCTMPPRLGSIAALALTNQHKPGGSPRLCRQLQTTPRDQGKGPFRFRNDQPNAFGSQRLFGGPEQVRLICRANKMQPFPDAFGQPAKHRLVWGMSGNDPDQSVGVQGSLQQSKAAPALALGLMDTIPRQCKSRIRSKITSHLLAPLRQRFATSRQGGAAGASGSPRPVQSASAAIPRAA